MLPADFEYASPDSLEEALALLAGRDDARLLAGGQSLLPTLKLRLDRPGMLVDLGRIEALRYIRVDRDEVAIGALTTYREIVASDPLRSGGARCLVEAAASVGDLQVRNLGTIGGSLSHADPAADLPAAVLALDASLVARSADAERTIPATDFFRGLWTTALRPGEILTEVRFAIPPGGGSAYEKFRQAASGFALAGAAAVVQLDGRTIASARVALTGVSSGPVRLHSVEEDLAGGSPSEELVREACGRAAEAIGAPLDDAHGSAEYRVALAEVAARRAILRAVG